ncbi:esterase B1-like [Ctenocephalides felis]|uniref:esterase B1-like n=1 Tax=Ctenocephalides felis TaxID=7515 RepID=UPI000E6E1F28|nr:esterase B1-like [Ctenocephalides felis]
MTDRFFAHGVRRSIHHHRGSKYVYKFAVDSPTNNLHRIKYCGKEVTGTCHADEVSYIFNSSSSQRYEEGTVEQKTINLITDLLSKFAQNKSKAPQWSKLWPEWAENQEHVLHISNGGLEVIDGLFKERMKFWNELYKNASSTI